MYIDDVFQTVQALLNKEQLGYLKPLNYNLFLDKAVTKVYNQMFPDHKSNVRKANWMLDGKHLADTAEHSAQLLEHFTVEDDIDADSAGVFILPTNIEKLEDVFNVLVRIEKVSYSDFKDLQRNIYAAPSACNPICAKLGTELRVLPNTIDPITVHYVRRPEIAKWTYTEVSGRAMFNPSANDFKDIDMPLCMKDTLISLVFEDASIYLRDFNATAAANQEQQEDLVRENKE